MTSNVGLRHKLHQYAELSFEENQTRKVLEEYINKYNPDQVISPIAKTGIAFVFKGDSNKPKTLIRADLDALPISESCQLNYHSLDKNVSHKCGHDGHMTMVASVASELSELNDRGDVILYFQPAEEIGEGALASVNDEAIKALAPDYVFGLHNIPGYPLGSIITKDNTLCCGSVGMKIHISGQTSHASEPQLVNSPFDQFIDYQRQLKELNNTNAGEDYFLCTMTHMSLGEKSFGITPANLTVFLTIRAENQDVLDKNTQKIIDEINSKFSAFSIEIKLQDRFPCTTNTAAGMKHIYQALKSSGLEQIKLDEAIKWSEDFGHYTQYYNGAFFGLGAGDIPSLHHPDYDFPDELIEYGTKFYLALIKSVNM